MDKYEGHTPGPWRVDPDSTILLPEKNDDNLVAIVTDAYCIAIAVKQDAPLLADAPTILAERDALVKRVEVLEAAMSEACLRLDASGICRVRVVPAMDILHKALEAEENNDE